MTAAVRTASGTYVVDVEAEEVIGAGDDFEPPVILQAAEDCEQRALQLTRAGRGERHYGARIAAARSTIPALRYRCILPSLNSPGVSPGLRGSCWSHGKPMMVLAARGGYYASRCSKD